MASDAPSEGLPVIGHEIAQGDVRVIVKGASGRIHSGAGRGARWQPPTGGGNRGRPGLWAAWQAA